MYTNLLLISALAIGSVSAMPASVPSRQPRNLDSIVSKIASIVNPLGNFTIDNPPFFAAAYVSNNDQTGTMSDSELSRYATYAGAAYKVNSTSWNCHLNCEQACTAGTVIDLHWSIGTPASTGYIAHNPSSKEIFLVYRGSYTVEDWLEDFTFLQVPSPLTVPGSLMHTGFLFAYSSMDSKVKATLQGLLNAYPDYTLIVTGHSLGAGEAAVAATDFAITKPEWIPRMKLITFGQPRVGNIVHAKWLSQQKFPIFRVVNRGDPVPHVPTIAMNYYHEAQQVWYDMSGKTTFCGRDGDSKECSDSVPLNQWSWNQHNEYPGLYFEPLYHFKIF